MKVTFCGHRDILCDPDVIRKLRRAVKKCIKLGADEFLLGGYGGFDLVSAHVVKEFKEQYPYIRSVLVIPYPDMEYRKDLYDCSEYPPLENVPKKFAITKRNEWMVDNSDVLIAYIEYTTGGALKTFEYAKRKKKPYVNLAEQI